MWDRPDNAAIPAPVASVRLGGILAFSCVDDDEEPVLFVSDGATPRPDGAKRIGWERSCP